MKIVIDTKEDLHNLRHIIQLLHAISVNAGSRKKYDYDTSPDLFSESSSPSSSSPIPETPTGIFNMFDTSSSSSSSPSSSVTDIPDIFQQKKEDDDPSNLADSLQTY